MKLTVYIIIIVVENVMPVTLKKDTKQVAFNYFFTFTRNYKNWKLQKSTPNLTLLT